MQGSLERGPCISRREAPLERGKIPSQEGNRPRVKFLTSRGSDHLEEGGLYLKSKIQTFRRWICLVANRSPATIGLVTVAISSKMNKPGIYPHLRFSAVP